MIAENGTRLRSQGGPTDMNSAKGIGDQTMGSAQVKAKKGESGSVRDGTAMKGKGTKGAPILDVIPEREQLIPASQALENYNDHVGNKEEHRCDLSSIPLIDEEYSEEISPNEDGNNNNSDQVYIRDNFTIENEIEGNDVRQTFSSGYSSQEEENQHPFSIIAKDSKTTKSTLKVPHRGPQNEELKRVPRERRTSVQFADEEDLPGKKSPTSRNKGLRLIIPPPNQRRSTLANVYEPNALNLMSEARRDSMPPNLQRTQLGRSNSKRTFTVVNYGNVGREASVTIPTGRESVTVLELLEDDQPGSAVPSIPDSEISQDFLDESREIVTLGGGRKLSVVHVDGPVSPELYLKDFSDEADEPDNVFHDIEIEQSQYNASGGKKSRQTQAIVKRGKDYGHRKKDRLVNKDGAINICQDKISWRNYRFILDLFTTLLDLQWRWVWAIFTVAFLASWFGFGLIWWAIAWLHGDFEPRTGLSPPVCVDNLDGFKSALLYSIETQHTIGYGSRGLTPECPLAFIALIAQSLLGVIVQCIMAGVVFAKLAKPKNRAETVLFSKNANVCLEDGDYCLVIRVGDMRRSQLVGCNLRAFLARRHVTLEGREIPFHTSHLHVQAECEEHDQSLFLAWPTRIIHRITHDSPLWQVGEGDLLKEQFEIIVVLEATIESSGMTTQIRTSYLPSEIKWGVTFLPLLTRQKSNTQVVIDYSNFNESEDQAHMPKISAMMYHLRDRRSGTGGGGGGLTPLPLQYRTNSCRSISVRSRAESCYQGSRYMYGP